MSLYVDPLKELQTQENNLGIEIFENMPLKKLQEVVKAVKSNNEMNDY